MAPKHEQLTEMSDADLIGEYNHAAPNVVVGLEGFRFELWRREAARQTKAVIWLTVWCLCSRPQTSDSLLPSSPRLNRRGTRAGPQRA